MVNKSPNKYGKKTTSSANSRPSSLDGNRNDHHEVETYKGLPQHIKAAKLLLDSGKEVKSWRYNFLCKNKNWRRS